MRRTARRRRSMTLRPTSRWSRRPRPRSDYLPGLSHRGGSTTDKQTPMSIANSIRAQIPPIHPEGYPFIGGFALASLVLFWIWTPLGWIGTLLTVWCALFFRDPARGTPVREGLVGAPTDGRVPIATKFRPRADPALADKPLLPISIFMSVFNCHV